jgi:hypothetical protein
MNVSTEYGDYVIAHFPSFLKNLTLAGFEPAPAHPVLMLRMAGARSSIRLRDMPIASHRFSAQS